MRRKAARPNVLTVEIGVVLPFPVLISSKSARHRTKQSDVPRAIKKLVSPFMQLHPLPVQLLFQNKRSTAHLLNRLFDLRGWPFTKHRCERAKELDLLVLWEASATIHDKNLGESQTAALRRFFGSHSSQATFLRSEQVLNRS